MPASAEPSQTRIEQLCAQKRLRMTGQRRVIARVLSAARDHPDVEEVYRRSNRVDARISLSTGAPIVMGFVRREPDGRMTLDIEPPLAIEDPEAPDAALRLTALHSARLEARVRAQPAMWFWLHRRWKTQPRAESRPASDPGAAAAGEPAGPLGVASAARHAGGRA